MGSVSEITIFGLLIGIVAAGDINRQAIVFYPETPDVFYCPQEKPISLEGMLVKARPMKKLCEYEGKALPQDYKSDCWNDVDETEFACAEKARILLKLSPPGSENAIIDNYVPIFRPGEYKIRHLDDKGRFKDTEDKQNEATEDAAKKEKEDKKRRPKTSDL